MFFKENMAGQLKFEKLHLNKPQDSGAASSLWTYLTKVEMFGHNALHQQNTAHLHLITTVKLDGGLMIWACFAAT